LDHLRFYLPEHQESFAPGSTLTILNTDSLSLLMLLQNFWCIFAVFK